MALSRSDLEAIRMLIREELARAAGTTPKETEPEPTDEELREAEECGRRMAEWQIENVRRFKLGLPLLDRPPRRRAKRRDPAAEAIADLEAILSSKSKPKSKIKKPKKG